jgi:hypothetical protein
MVEIEKLKQIHLDFISWLKTQKDIPNINEYIAYVENELELYEIYNKNKDTKIFSNLSRSLNRYRDEFNFNIDAIKKAYSFFEKMREFEKHLTPPS